MQVVTASAGKRMCRQLKNNLKNISTIGIKYGQKVFNLTIKTAHEE